MFCCVNRKMFFVIYEFSKTKWKYVFTTCYYIDKDYST